MSTSSSERTFLAFIGSLIEERTGIHYEPKDESILADKVGMRARDAGFESIIDYYYSLRYDDASGSEFRALCDVVVVNESYLYRERDQLDAIVDDVVPRVIARDRRPRIWSAACASGEEPITLAMMLADRGLLDGVDILASDLSERALERARSGILSRRALRALPPSAERWLEPGERDRAVSPEILRAIRFERINLVDSKAVESQLLFDVILCRNALIYFSDETVSKVVSSLAKVLRPDGHLFLGASESLMRLTTELVCEERRGVFHYRKASR